MAKKMSIFGFEYPSRSRSTSKKKAKKKAKKSRKSNPTAPAKLSNPRGRKANASKKTAKKTAKKVSSSAKPKSRSECGAALVSARKKRKTSKALPHGMPRTSATASMGGACLRTGRMPNPVAALKRSLMPPKLKK